MIHIIQTFVKMINKTDRMRFSYSGVFYFIHNLLMGFEFKETGC